MKILGLLFLVLSRLLPAVEAPQELPAESFAPLIDQCLLHLNPLACPLCSNPSFEKPTLEKELNEAEFRKIEREVFHSGHCFGACAFFSKYLFANPESLSHSCEAILSTIVNDPRFIQERHLFSTNQPCDYLEPSAPPPVNHWGNPMHLNPPAMKKFLTTLLKKAPDSYLLPYRASPSALNYRTIFETLQKYPDHLLLASLTHPKGIHHLVAVVLSSQKVLFFNPNEGLFHFRDVETLSWAIERQFQGWIPRWIASFPLPKEGENQANSGNFSFR